LKSDVALVHIRVQKLCVHKVSPNIVEQKPSMQGTSNTCEYHIGSCHLRAV